MAASTLGVDDISLIKIKPSYSLIGANSKHRGSHLLNGKADDLISLDSTTGGSVGSELNCAVCPRFSFLFFFSLIFRLFFLPAKCLMTE